MRFRPLIVLVCVASVVVGSCSTGTHQATPSTSSAVPQSASSTGRWPTDDSQSQISHDIETKGLTPERALMLFSIEIGPLPGVPHHTGPVDRHDFDGSDAYLALVQEWKQISPAQRAAVRRLLDVDQHLSSDHPPAKAEPGPTTVPPTSKGATPPTTIADRLGDVTVQPAVARATTDAPAQDYWTMASTANADLASHLGVAPLPQWYISIDYQPPIGAEFAHTSLFDTDGSPNGVGCVVFLWNQKFASINAAEASLVIAHELFHCYQERITGSVATQNSIHMWMREGSASWVALMIRPAGSTVMAGYWSKYSGRPQYVYAGRDYDAVGVFGHLGDLIGQDAVWPRLFPAISDSISGMDTMGLHTLVGGDRFAFFSTWGASFFQRSGLSSWYMVGPGLPATTAPAPSEITVGSGAEEPLATADGGSVSLTNVTSNADVVTVSLLSGYGRVSDQPGAINRDLDLSMPVALCLKDGGCDCPEGSPGNSLKLVQAVAPLSVGLGADDQQAAGSVSGFTLPDFCHVKPPEEKSGRVPAGSPSGGGSGIQKDKRKPVEPVGRVVGDPHVDTFDGAGIEFQTVGEFVFARSSSGDFELQERTAAMPQSRSWSRTTALAMKAGGHTIEWTLESGQPITLVDGKPVASLTGHIGTVRVDHHESIVGPVDDVSLDDGTLVAVSEFDNTLYNVQVTPASTRRGHLAGVLGNDNGSVDDDLVGTGGPASGGAITPDFVNHELADQWRVTPANSLFTYPPGKSTTDYTDRAFPYAGAPANTAEARRACRDAGVTDPVPLERCVIDFAATSSPLYTLYYGYGQAVDRAQGRRTASGPATPTRSIAFSGSLTKANHAADKKRLERAFTVKVGDVIQGAGQGCNDLGGLISLTFPANGARGVTTQAPCSIGRIEFPKAGTVHLKALIADQATGHYTFTLRWIRPDRVESTRYGRTLSGTIPAAGVHDVYRFTGAKGDVVTTYGPGCTNPKHLVFGVRDMTNSQLGFGALCDRNASVTLPRSGRYQLVVNVTDNNSGSYEFVLQKRR